MSVKLKGEQLQCINCIYVICLSGKTSSWSVDSRWTRGLQRLCSSTQGHVLQWYERNQIFLIYKEIQSGAVAKSYGREGFLIYEEMRKYFSISEEAVRHIWVCNCSIQNFLIYEENLNLFFISVRLFSISYIQYLKAKTFEINGIWLRFIWPSLCDL